MFGSALDTRASNEANSERVTEADGLNVPLLYPLKYPFDTAESMDVLAQ